MAKTTKATMTELLRQALRDAEGLYGVAKATGVERASLIRFRDGRQSLRLDVADTLAAYFHIHVIRTCPRERGRDAGG